MKVVEVLKIKEFAIQEGVTTQAVYKLLKTHSEALEGHVLKTKKGQLLDEYAISYLQEKMIGNNVVVADRSIQEELDKVKAELKAMQDELIVKNQLLINSQNQYLQLEASRNEEIKAVEEKMKGEIELLEGFIKDAKANMEHAEEEKKAAVKEAEDRVKLQHQETENKLRNHYQEEIQRLQTELQVERNKSWWDKLRRR